MHSRFTKKKCSTISRDGYPTGGFSIIQSYRCFKRSQWFFRIIFDYKACIKKSNLSYSTGKFYSREDFGQKQTQRTYQYRQARVDLYASGLIPIANICNVGCHNLDKNFQSECALCSYVNTLLKHSFLKIYRLL